MARRRGSSPGALPLLSTALLELWQQRDGRGLRLAAYERTRRRPAARSRAWPRTRTRASTPPQQQGRAPLMLRLAGERRRRRGRAAPRRRWPSSTDERRRRRRSRAAPRAPADRRRGRRSRSRTRRSCASGRGCADGSRRTPRAPAAAPPPTPPATGRPTAATRPSSTAARGWRRRSTGPPRTSRARRHRVRVPRPQPARERARAAPRCDRRCGRLAALAGRRRRSWPARRARSARPGPRAGDARRTPSASAPRRWPSDEPDRALLLARQGVALSDSAQTRGNLLTALLRSPAPIGVMHGEGAALKSLALSPDGRTLAILDADRRVAARRRAHPPQPGRAADGRASSFEQQGPRRVWPVALDPSARRRPVRGLPELRRSDGSRLLVGGPWPRR